MAASRWSRGRETSVKRASVVVGLVLRFALNAHQGFAPGNPNDQIKDESKKKNENQKQEKGTFLKRFDTTCVQHSQGWTSLERGEGVEGEEFFRGLEQEEQDLRRKRKRA